MAFNREMHDNGCPCKGCGDRNPGCHDRCERYGEWHKKKEETANIRRKYMESLDTMSDSYKKFLLKKQKDRRGVKRYDSFLKSK